MLQGVWNCLYSCRRWHPGGDLAKEAGLRRLGGLLDRTDRLVGHSGTVRYAGIALLKLNGKAGGRPLIPWLAGAFRAVAQDPNPPTPTRKTISAIPRAKPDKIAITSTSHMPGASGLLRL
jgi:hypothetical protein